MLARRLILIEGMIGAGKSTTAERLVAWLAGRGEDARAYNEGADDHPIRTEAVDLLRAASAGLSPAQVDPNVYDVAQWEALAERCVRGAQAIILESTFLQNSVLPLFANDAPRAEIKEAYTAIEARIAPANPLLIYLRPSDIPAAVERVHAERGEPWSSRNVGYVSTLPWVRRRGLAGRQAVVELYRAWEPVVDDLLRASILSSTIVVDPQRDWDGAMRRIGSVVRESARV